MYDKLSGSFILEFLKKVCYLTVLIGVSLIFSKMTNSDSIGYAYYKSDKSSNRLLMVCEQLIIHA